MDGSRVQQLGRQMDGVQCAEGDVALVTVGGNDLLGGLLMDTGPGFGRFQAVLEAALQRLAPARILLGNVYDPTFGDDRADFVGIDPALTRPNLDRMNALLADVAHRFGALADLHAHFLTGRPSWFAYTIEPSLEGASEVRRVFLRHLLPG